MMMMRVVTSTTTKQVSKRLLCGQRRRNSSNSSSLSRYGLGGQNWRRFDPQSYQELIHTALAKQVSYMEVAGQEGGEIAMVGGIQSALHRSPEFSTLPLTITTRIGYRSLLVEASGEKKEKPQTIALPGDVLVTEEGSGSAPSIAHNLSSDYILNTLELSPLLELQDEMKQLKLVVLLHNPEVQVMELLKEDPNATLEERQAYIKHKWEPALATLQEYSTANTNMSFGVVSNGLGIPADHKHPMHLDAQSVIDAAKSHDRFSTVELPANLLETHGWHMARKIHSAVPSVSVVAMRPMTCYPDLGAGTGFPFRLVDYALPSMGDGTIAPLTSNEGGVKPGQTVQFTNEMTGIPAIYQIALQAAMSHFDAEELLEIKQERDLTMEERETLDGCKLVQSMVHDLDTELENVRSFAAHEDELFGRIIPLLHDTFESMDDRTSDVLQAYFAAYAIAVRYAIAKKTRQLLKKGDGDSITISGAPTYPDIPQSMTLQEYSLRHMLADKCMSRIVTGASTMQDFRNQTELIEKISSEESPLDAIAQANDLEQRKKELDDAKADKPAN
jgi:hypothetical protein